MEISIGYGLKLIAVGICILTCCGAGVGIGVCFGAANQAIARQPELMSRIMSTTILGVALSEATAIYGIVFGLLILFAF